MARYPHGNPSTNTQRQTTGGLIASLLACLALATGVAWATPQPGSGVAFELRATNGTHMAEASERTTLVEEVTLPEAYEPGDYELSVTLHLRDTDSSDAGTLMASDGEVMTTATLSPNDEGKMLLPVAFDARDFAGKSVVAFVTLSKDGSVVAKSEDIANGAQAVHLPKVETSLADKDGDTELAGQHETELAAKVCWSNVDPDSGLRILVTLADADSDEALHSAEGREITAIVSIPQDKDGKVEESGTVETQIHDDISVEVTIEQDEGEQGSSNIDWTTLLATNPSVVAWCHVECTGIDLPVCQATDDGPEHWLTHDLWGDESPAGTPYVDHRATASSQHVLCYGHHLTGTGGMFSELYRCHEQDEFDRVLTGDLLWSTPDGRTLRLHPLCATVVDKDDANIQHFGFVNDADFHLWLKETLARSSARNNSTTTLAASATRAITLVTCSSDLSGRPERTIVKFAT